MLWATFLPVFLLCQAREINELPGLTFNVGFKHYTGFFQVSKTHFLHYWFVESQNDSTKDPLIFWFNGGPGCSSLAGLLLEMGPYLVNADGRSLRSNLYSWNKGIAIGNGYVSTKLHVATMAQFAYGHGIIDETLWSGIVKQCCNGDFGSCDSSQDRKTFVFLHQQTISSMRLPGLSAHRNKLNTSQLQQ
ncbi:serine carboxypeptidase [Oesophagostomum dentatum]|uniref:Serine carboxypeptidase n=1 Tax=Oesophagostomum dentatum TaxID=61180 RepID=A0A0B1S8Y0_OESDE|nr:serine carboxypeptidase [Oesophagostomum dentatum]